VVASLEILLHAIYSLRQPPHIFEKNFFLPPSISIKTFSKTFPASRSTVSLAGKPICSSFVFDPLHTDPPTVIADRVPADHHLGHHL